MPANTDLHKLLVICLLCGNKNLIRMVKKILSVIAGIIAGTIVIYLVEMLSSKVYPPPPGVDIMKDKEALIEFIKNAPMSAMLLVLLGYVLGSFVAGWVSSRISGSLRQALISGVVLMAFGIMNLVEIPQPLWFGICSTICYIPLSYPLNRRQSDYIFIIPERKTDTLYSRPTVTPKLISWINAGSRFIRGRAPIVPVMRFTFLKMENFFVQAMRTTQYLSVAEKEESSNC